ncbi:DUF4199 domain-containing protein [Salinimicrobium xinjiangense]|uniref:DUF4199 domain-containing protein n=1 Tax=Salinimicrobium xinjiangense TaxID=438596 RepID=UPI0004125FA6|nr:DUF4199 domain-containing protein [Salinimicrobium xinjiangense]
MEAQQAKARKFVLNYGLILGILLVLLGVIMYVLNYHLKPHWSFMVITFAVFIAVVVYGIKGYKKENGGFLSIGEAIKVAVGIALIAAIISGLWVVVLSTILEPDYMEQAIELQKQEAFANNPALTEEQWEKGLEMSAAFRGPWITFAFTLVVDMLFGLIVGLIAGAIMKQRRPYEV